MNLKEEGVKVTLTDMTEVNLLFELKAGGLVVMTEEGHQARSVGRIPEVGEPWETDFHEWCAEYVHAESPWAGRVLMTQARAGF